jgi:peptidoglycan/LPS O-acetylase OafA/YrhL
MGYLATDPHRTEIRSDLACPARNQTHLPQLDGLRAIAVIGVLISHFFPSTDYLYWLSSTLPWGFLGVRLFFVISGFLISGILLERRDAILLGKQTCANALASFYARRILRILPIFYLTLLVAYVCDVGNIREIIKWHLFYLSNFEPAMIVDFKNPSPRDPTSAHFWSLAVEEQFYLLWPAILLNLDQVRAKHFILAMICVAVGWRAGWLLFVPSLPSMSLLSCLDSLGMGALLAIWIHGGQAHFDRTTKVTLAAGMLLLAACCVASAFGILFRPRAVLMDLGASIVFAALVYRATQGRKDLLGKTLQWGPLLYIGKISYGIYIYHAFMSPLLVWIWSQADLPAVSPNSVIIPLTLCAMTIIVASFSWYLIEQPINRLKRFIPRGPSPELPPRDANGSVSTASAPAANIAG